MSSRVCFVSRVAPASLVGAAVAAALSATYAAPARAQQAGGELAEVTVTGSRMAIAEANRYSRVRIELHEPSLAQARISGVFDTGRNEALANALRAYFGLTLQRVGEDRILLLADSR